MKRKLLILDIDETLIFAVLDKLDRNEDFRIGDYFVYKRPCLNAFLQSVARSYEIAVWTSSSSSYAQVAVNALFENVNLLRFVWTRERCTQRFNHETREHYWVKDLKKVKKSGFSLEQIIVVDDSPEKLERNYGNHIQIRPFQGDVNDSELLDLQKYLEFLKNTDNVRFIDKRNWRQVAHNGCIYL